MNLNKYFDGKIRRIDRSLEGILPRGGFPKALGEAMRYAVFPGGKRIRPVLALEAARVVGGREAAAMPAALAVELIHSYSLIHDDLPCMDDDDTRRGRPSCHRRFGEQTALLAGDALLTLAFQVLGEAGAPEAAAMIARAAGVGGMVGGQAADLCLGESDEDVAQMEFIHAHKTGALIAVSLKAGAHLAGGGPAEVECLGRFGKGLGFLFQIVDDILDGEGYAKITGPVKAKQEAVRVHARACRELQPLGARAAALKRIADFVLTRKR